MDERTKASLDRWITGNYGEDQFRDEEPEEETEEQEEEIPDRVYDWLDADIAPPVIHVACTECGIDYDEQAVKILDISEGLLGEDILKFVCPKGHETSSRRRG